VYCRPPHITPVLALEGAWARAVPEHQFLSAPNGGRRIDVHNAGIVPDDQIARLMPLNRHDILWLCRVIQQLLDLDLALLKRELVDLVCMVGDV
jgi:hypothetical protein